MTISGLGLTFANLAVALVCFRAGRKAILASDRRWLIGSAIVNWACAALAVASIALRGAE